MISPAPLPPGKDDFKILLDIPAVQVGSEFDRYAVALAQVIEHSTPRFAVGVFGTWGAGKTTLMRAVERTLRPDLCIPVRFSAWQYEKEEHLVVPLLDTVRQALVEWAQSQAGLDDKVKDGVVKTARVLGRVLTSLVAGLSVKWGIPKAFEMTLDSTKALAKASDFADADKEAATPKSFYFACFQALKEIFGGFSELTQLPNGVKRRIVVFIDDLDRCLPENALDVLESIKLFFDVDSFVFVVGLDQQVVEAAVSAKYAKEHAALTADEKSRFRVEGSEYVKKIFQLYFILPRVHRGMVDSFLNSVYADATLSEEQKAYLTTVVRPHLDFLVTDAGLNPREIKRYINTYLIQEKIQRVLRPHLDQNILLALQTVQFRRDWALVLEALYTYRPEFIRAIASYPQDQKSLENLDPRLAALPPRFLDYAQEVGLGSVANIEDYIYSGSFSSAGNLSAEMADIIRDLTRLRPILNSAASSASAVGTAPGENLPDQLIGYLQSASHTAAMRGVISALNELKQELATLSGLTDEKRTAWLERWQSWITATISALIQNG